MLLRHLSADPALAAENPQAARVGLHWPQPGGPMAETGAGGHSRPAEIPG